MNALASAFQELTRVAQRGVNQLQLMLDRRKLAQLETALGLLGWQQADYDEGTQMHANRVIDYEREQMRLTNESAALALEIEKIRERRGVAEREFAEARAAALEKEHPSAATVETLEAHLSAGRDERKAIEGRLPVLDRELNKAEEQYRKLVPVASHRPDAQEELLNLRKLILAMPKEKAEWVAKLDRTKAEIAAMETLLAALAEAREEFEKRDREFGDEIAGRLREKRKMEKEIESLERSKTDPYREIGRTLADHDIAPLNQPEALVAVVQQRTRISGREVILAASRAESARAGWKKLIMLFTSALLALAEQ